MRVCCVRVCVVCVCVLCAFVCCVRVRVVCARACCVCCVRAPVVCFVLQTAGLDVGVHALFAVLSGFVLLLRFFGVAAGWHLLLRAERGYRSYIYIYITSIYIMYIGIYIVCVYVCVCMCVYVCVCMCTVMRAYVTRREHNPFTFLSIGLVLLMITETSSVRSAVRCCTLWRDVLCCAVLCCAVLCCAVLCCAVMCCDVMWCVVMCCAVM